MLFLKLFFTFFKIGMFSFGGGYSMITLLQSELVYDHGWMSSAEFTNIVALSQMTPGPIGVNAATYCGYTAVHNAETCFSTAADHIARHGNTAGVGDLHAKIFDIFDLILRHFNVGIF